jgi:hypothetical protein
VQQELERLASDLIVYNPAAEMAVDKAERVEVRIGMDMTAPITTGLKGAGTPTIESIHVSCFMKVRLVGEAFDVVALSSEEQIVRTRPGLYRVGLGRHPDAIWQENLVPHRHRPGQGA